jgi:hypothetical protein
MKACSECGTARFGLIRHRWGFHVFCTRGCMERFQQRLFDEVRRRKLSMSGQPRLATSIDFPRRFILAR